MNKKIILGSRGSLLALAQSNIVLDKLLNKNKNIEIEIKIITTTGDKDLTSHYKNSEYSLKKFFTKEIEEELLDKKIDFAVHSMKDMPTEITDGLIYPSVPSRAEHRDVIISKNKIALSQLLPCAIVGTSSLRRAKYVSMLRPDLIVEPIRGNIDTRLKKLRSLEYDAIILAAAGLIRLGLQNEISHFFDIDEMMPSPAQGALCLQCRDGDEYIINILKSINDEDTSQVVKIEREFSRIFDGGCHTPVGCFGSISNDIITLNGSYFKNEKFYNASIVENKSLGLDIARKLSEQIFKLMESKNEG